MDLRHDFWARRKALVATLVIVLLANSASAQVTIDFTTYNPGDGVNVNIFSWLFSVTLDGSGSVLVTDENFAGNNGDNLGVGADPTGLIDGNPAVQYTGSVPAGITGEVFMLMDGFPSDGETDTSILIDDDGTGVGVSGRNSTRIDWNSDPAAGGGADLGSEALYFLFDTDDLVGGYLIVTELGFTDLDAPADPVVGDFDGVGTQFPVGTTSATLGGEGYTLAPDETDIMLVFDGDDGTLESQGFAVASITFDMELLGDLDFSGTLDSVDIDLFIAGWRSDTSALDFAGKVGLGDVNLDGFTDFSDLYLMREAFLAAGVPVSATLFAVPEPGVGLLLGLGVANFLSIRWRKTCII